MSGSSETGCCPRFDPGPWDEGGIEFRDRLFLSDHVRTFLHIPLNFGRVMKRAMARIESAGVAEEEPLILSEMCSPWRTEVFVAVEGEVPGAKMTRLSGTFLTRVFDGPYSRCRQWIESTKADVAAQGRTVRRLFVYYTTCPRCAKAYGRNYVVILAQIA